MKIIEVQLSNTPQSDYILSVPGVEGICVISGCRQKGFVKMLATTNLFYWALCKSPIYLLSKTKAEINNLWKTEKHFQTKMPISNFIFCIFTVIHCNTVKISFNRLKQTKKKWRKREKKKRERKVLLSKQLYLFFSHPEVFPSYLK